jgi:hypothetical protein
VTVGGSLCIESLVNTGTPTGWQPANSMWAILVQCKQLLVDGGGRIDFSQPYPYTKQEALAAFTRVASDHGWLSYGGGGMAGLSKKPYIPKKVYTPKPKSKPPITNTSTTAGNGKRSERRSEEEL